MAPLAFCPLSDGSTITSNRRNLALGWTEVRDAGRQGPPRTPSVSEKDVRGDEAMWRAILWLLLLNMGQRRDV